MIFPVPRSRLSPYPLPLTPLAFPLSPYPLPLTPYSYLAYRLTPYSYRLTPIALPLTPYSYLLSPYPLPLSPYSSLLSPYSYLLSPYPLPLTLHSINTTAKTSAKRSVAFLASSRLLYSLPTSRSMEGACRS